MAIKKQLKDKDGNTIYPDVGLNLDDVVYSDDPEPISPPDPWIETGDITNNAVTSDKVNLTTVTSTTSSISLTAGTWLVTHKVSVGQSDVSNAIILMYTLTNFPSQTTIAGKCNAQTLWQTACETAIMTLNSTTLIKRTNSTSINAETRDEYWTATRIK